MVEVFTNDEQGYFTWKKAHPLSYIVNTDGKQQSTYTILHEASCGSLNPTDGDAESWTIAYQKVCGKTRDELTEWCKTNLNTVLTPCGMCQPNG